MSDGQGTTARGDGTTAWRRLGAGRPLLMINGYAATNADWDPGFLEQLGRCAELICPDNRGLGDSARGSAEITIESMAADALAVLDDLGIERAPVLGWSMGGFVAQTLAASAPGRVEALVLLGTDEGGPGALRTDAETWAQLTDHGGTPREQASRLIRLLFPEPPASSIDEQFGELVAAARARLDPEVLSDQERAMRDWHGEPAEARLAAIGAPALCAAGAEDVVIPAGNAERLAARLPGPGPEILPAGGHAFMAQDPQRLSELIRAFLGR